MYKQNKMSIIDSSKDVEFKPMIELEKFIDRCIIDEYATKNLEEGYYLDVDQIPAHDQNILLAKMLEADTALRDHALSCMQKMIDERITEVELEERDYLGFASRQDDSGDIYLMRYSA
jgi:hypothetical protein